MFGLVGKGNFGGFRIDLAVLFTKSTKLKTLRSFKHLLISLLTKFGPIRDNKRWDMEIVDDAKWQVMFYDVMSFNHLSKWWSTFWLNVILVEPTEVDSSIKHLSKNPREITVKESSRNVCERILRKCLWKTLKKAILNETNCKLNFTFLKYTIKAWFQSLQKRSHKNKTAKP